MYPYKFMVINYWNVWTENSKTVNWVTRAPGSQETLKPLETSRSEVIFLKEVVI